MAKDVPPGMSGERKMLRRHADGSQLLFVCEDALSERIQSGVRPLAFELASGGKATDEMESRTDGALNIYARIEGREELFGFGDYFQLFVILDIKRDLVQSRLNTL